VERIDVAVIGAGVSGLAAARAIAEEYFEAGKVAARLLRDVGLA